MRFVSVDAALGQFLDDVSARRSSYELRSSEGLRRSSYLSRRLSTFGDIPACFSKMECSVVQWIVCSTANHYTSLCTLYWEKFHLYVNRNLTFLILSYIYIYIYISEVWH